MAKNQAIFKPVGPFDIKFENMPGGKRITKSHINDFWTTSGGLSEKIKTKKGVYVFGMKVTKGMVPCYVGKTKNTFEKECFTDRNLNIYNGEIIRYERNYKPFMFFLVYQNSKGRQVSDKVIRELEKFVINLATEKNPELANTRGLIIKMDL